MRDDLPDWLEAEPEASEPRRRRPVLVALIVLPWFVLVALLVGPRVVGQPRTGDSADPASERPGPPPPASPYAAADPDAAVQPGAIEEADPRDRTRPEIAADVHPGDGHVGAGDGATAALAVAVARAWLTGIDPLLPLAGIEPISAASYVEHLVVEAVERPEEGAAVVTLLAVVLETADDRSARVQRLAVPVVEAATGPQPAGPPWPLRPPDLTPSPIPNEPVADPAHHLDALEALTSSSPGAWGGTGWGGETGEDAQVELISLGRSTSWPWIAEVRIRSTDDRTWEGAVWLRRHADGFTVAGLPLHPAAELQPEPDVGELPALPPELREPPASGSGPLEGGSRAVDP